jgi:hypothetical protein
MGLHGLTDALCFPRKAKQTWATMLGSIRKWSAEDEPFRTQSEQFNAKVMDPRKWVFFLFPGVDRSAPPAVDPREMAFFLRCLDPIMHCDSGAVLSSCIASGDAITLEEVAIVEAFITNIRRRPATVAVLRLDPTTSTAISSAAVGYPQGKLYRRLLGALKLMAEAGAIIVPGVPASYMPADAFAGASTGEAGVAPPAAAAAAAAAATAAAAAGAPTLQVQERGQEQVQERAQERHQRRLWEQQS